MQQAHMAEVAKSLEGLADVFGKPHPTKAAMVHWWETLKEFDYNDVMGVFGYWAKESNRMPTPKEVWDKLNDARTQAIERKAKQERAENRGDRLPSDWHPTEYGRKMMAQLKAMVEHPAPKNNRPEKWPISMRRRAVSG